MVILHKNSFIGYGPFTKSFIFVPWIGKIQIKKILMENRRSFSLRGLRANQRALSALRALRATWRGLRSSQRGLTASRRDLRASRRGLRASQRGLRASKRGLKPVGVFVGGSSKSKDGHSHFKLISCWQVTAQKILLIGKKLKAIFDFWLTLEERGFQFLLAEVCKSWAILWSEWGWCWH